MSRWMNFWEWLARKDYEPHETDYYCPYCHRFLYQKEVDENSHDKYCAQFRKND